MRDRVENTGLINNPGNYSNFKDLSDSLNVTAPNTLDDISFHKMPTSLPESGKDLLGKDEGFVLGARGHELMRSNIEGHLVTIGQTGSGKGRAVIIPNLLMYEGSVFSFEISGASYNATHHFRKEVLGQEIHIFDPLNVTGETSACFNVFDVLNPKRPNFLTLVDEIADSFLIHAEGIMNSP